MLALNAQYANSADRGLSESGRMVIVVFAVKLPPFLTKAIAVTRAEMFAYQVAFHSCYVTSHWLTSFLTRQLTFGSYGGNGTELNAPLPREGQILLSWKIDENQRWNVTYYIYTSNVLKCNSELLALYVISSISRYYILPLFYILEANKGIYLTTFVISYFADGMLRQSRTDSDNRKMLNIGSNNRPMRSIPVHLLVLLQ